MFTFEHRFRYRDGHSDPIPYRSTRQWKTAKGALRAAEKHAKALESHYDMSAISWHALAVIDLSNGLTVMSEAA